MNTINVAVVGVGSFTKALIEGVAFYTKNPDEERGLIHPQIGPYRVQDIRFVAAFDVDERKVGKKLHEAISAGANVTKQITEPLESSALVYRGPTLDGVIEEMRGTFVHESTAPSADIAYILKETGAEVVLNLLPTGSTQATFAYAEAALQAGCSFVNCIPTPLATLPEWKKRFADAGLCLLGDDIKSQLGATMLNRALLSLLKMRGITVTTSAQENRGGNADHYNLLYRAQAKETSKREALSQILGDDAVKPSVTFAYTGEPSGHKQVHLKLEGELFGRTPISIEAVIEDEISINGAGVAVDAIRVAKLLVERNQPHKSDDVCAFLMKSPARQMSDIESSESFERVLVET